MHLVTVKTFDSYFLANILLTKLHAEGIECYLKDEYTVSIDPILSNAIGGIKLVVKKKDEEMVKNLLDKYEKELINEATCPKCGNNSFTYTAKPGANNFITALLTLIFPGYTVPPDYVYQCGKCGFESENLPEPFVPEPLHLN